MLDNPSHENHGMFAAALRAVNDRDAQMGRHPDEVSRQLAGGLVEKARERRLETIGTAQFTPDGTKVGMDRHRRSIGALGEDRGWGGGATGGSELGTQ